MFLGESLGAQACEVEKTYDKPYLPQDFPKIKHWAVSRTTQLQREHAEGLIALCLGVGCTGAATSHLRARDVTRDENGTVWVKRYDMVHAVPVSAVFADVVAELTARKAPEEYVLGRGDKPVWHQEFKRWARVSCSSEPASRDVGRCGMRFGEKGSRSKRYWCSQRCPLRAPLAYQLRPYRPAQQPR